jgi:hypothetical protein
LSGPPNGFKLTITGDNFGVEQTALDIALTMEDPNCGNMVLNCYPSIPTQTSVTCDVPGGVGENYTLSFARSNLVANATSFCVSFYRPVITSVFPSSLSTSGGLIMITGNDLVLYITSAHSAESECMMLMLFR